VSYFIKSVCVSYFIKSVCVSYFMDNHNRHMFTTKLDKFYIEISIQACYLLDKKRYTIFPKNSPLLPFINRCINYNITNSIVTTPEHKAQENNIVHLYKTDNYHYNEETKTTTRSTSTIYEKKLTDYILSLIIQSENINGFKNMYTQCNNRDEDLLYLSIILTKEDDYDQHNNTMLLYTSIVYSTPIINHERLDHKNYTPNRPILYTTCNCKTQYPMNDMNEDLVNNKCSIEVSGYESLLNFINLDCEIESMEWLKRYHPNSRFKTVKAIINDEHEEG
jgi:hypothetical protein